MTPAEKATLEKVSDAMRRKEHWVASAILESLLATTTVPQEQSNE